jgi:hypothetical protein
MDLCEAVDDALEDLACHKPPLDKLSILNTLHDRIERNTFEVGYLEGRMENLLDLTIFETDVEVLNRMFDVVETAMRKNLSIAPSIDPLLPYLSDEEPAFICRVLLLIPRLGSSKHEPLARRYLTHEHAMVRKNAEYALKYLRGTGPAAPR